jgi:hypothetical protein
MISMEDDFDHLIIHFNFFYFFFK